MLPTLQVGTIPGFPNRFTASGYPITNKVLIPVKVAPTRGRRRFHLIPWTPQGFHQARGGRGGVTPWRSATKKLCRQRGSPRARMSTPGLTSSSARGGHGPPPRQLRTGHRAKGKAVRDGRQPRSQLRLPFSGDSWTWMPCGARPWSFTGRGIRMTGACAGAVWGIWFPDGRIRA